MKLSWNCKRVLSPDSKIIKEVDKDLSITWNVEDRVFFAPQEWQGGEEIKVDCTRLPK